MYLVFVLCRGIKIKFSVIFRSRYTASLLSVFFSVGLNSQTVLRRRSGSCTVLYQWTKVWGGSTRLQASVNSKVKCEERGV